MHQAHSFPPIVAAKPRVLILGSMPGIQSLAAQQYYAHPQNAFWKIMGDIFSADVSDYAARCDLILRHNLALWDVLKYCERDGSLDAAIKQDSMIVNDFAAFFEKHKTIAKVCLNGGAPAKFFKKHVIPQLPESVAAPLTLLPMPSTSSAYAGMRYAEKLKAWKKAVLQNV